MKTMIFGAVAALSLGVGAAYAQGFAQEMPTTSHQTAFAQAQTPTRIGNIWELGRTTSRPRRRFSGTKKRQVSLRHQARNLQRRPRWTKSIGSCYTKLCWASPGQ